MQNEKFADMMAEVKGNKTTDDLAEHAENRTEEGDPCPDGDCEHTLFALRHPRSDDTEIPRHTDAPELELVCIHHGIQATR